MFNVNVKSLLKRMTKKAHEMEKTYESQKFDSHISTLAQRIVDTSSA